MTFQRIQLEKNMQDLAVGIRRKRMNNLMWDNTKGMFG